MLKSLKALWKFFVLSALASTITVAVAGWGGAPKRPNIVLISIDTLRADHLGCYGYSLPTSPALDRFRRDAILFRQVVAAAPSTLPSHASIFTSLLPQHHGASHTQLRPLAKDALTVTEVLKGAGYRTLAAVGGGQIGPVFGLDQGFDAYEVVERPEDHRFRDPVRRGLELLGARPRQPFFLFLHTYQVHHPYKADPRRLATFDAGYTGPLPTEISIELLTEINEGRRKIEERDLRHIVHAYDAEIASVDSAFGLLILELQKRGLYRDALIVVTSDHGEEFGERGVMGWHSHTLYEELLRVPLLVKLPGQLHAGATVDAMVRSLDIAPTILAAAGLTPDPGFEGEDLMPFLRQARNRSRPAIFWRETMPFETGSFSGIRVGDWKLHAGKLFELRQDARETTDLAAREPVLREALERRLESELARRKPLQSMGVQIDDKTREALRSLGYIQ